MSGDRIVRDYFRAVDETRVDDVLAFFTEDASLRHPFFDGALVGHDAIRPFYAALANNYATALHEVVTMVDAGDRVACELIFTATTNDGVDVRFETCNVHRLREGRFSSLRIYGDALDMKRQLGLL